MSNFHPLSETTAEKSVCSHRLGGLYLKYTNAEIKAEST